MPSPSLWTQCASYFAGQGHWSVPEKGPSAEANDSAEWLVFETEGADRVWLSRAPQGESVRLFRMVGEPTIDGAVDLSEGSEQDLTSGWVWLHDEWSARYPSVMVRPSAGSGFPQAGALTVTCASSGVGLAVNATTPNITLGVRATTAGSALVNTACVASSGGPVDDQAGNNCASVSVTPQATGDQADLSALKRVLGIGDAPGNRQLAAEPVTWEIEVVNAGPNTATDVAVIDAFNNVFNALPSQYAISTVPGAATMGSCGLTASGSNVSLSNCSIASLPVCTAGVD